VYFSKGPAAGHCQAALIADEIGSAANKGEGRQNVLCCRDDCCR
jgi:hypothetical protein